jgi:hypothetical protein
MRFITIPAGFPIVLATSNYCFAKEWRGLTPLRSSRADVIRLLNQCSDEKEACAFTLGDESVYILFSGGLAENYKECAERLPDETVMFIDVVLTSHPPLRTLRRDMKKFRTFNPSDPVKMDLKGYWSDDEGLLIKTLSGKVLQLTYLAAPTDRASCLSFYEEPESFIRDIPVHVPVVILSCSPDSVTAGETIVARAYITVNARRGYTWVVSAGKIVSGQNTDKVTIDTSNVKEGSLIVTAEFNDGFGHTMTASCERRINK